MSTYDLPSAPSGAVIRDIGSAHETSQVARLLWLRSFFGEASSGRQLETLVARMTEFFIPKGKDLYVEGTTSDSIYFIVEGEIHHGTTGYTDYVSGDVLGFVDGMADRPHLHTAHVVKDALVLRLKIDDWLEHLEEHFTELRRMFTTPGGSNDAHPDEVDESDQVRWMRDANDTSSGATGLLVRRLLAVKTCPLFHRASIQAVAQLVRRAQIITLSAGTSLPPAQERPGLYVLQSGAVECAIGADDEVVEWETRMPGALLGSVSVLLKLPYTFQITATKDAEILYFHSEDYFDVMEDHFDVARSALGYFALRAETRNKRKGEAEQAQKSSAD